MGTALTGLQVSSTYNGLIKTTDNAVLSAALRVITDGFGNDSALQISTAGVSSSGTFAVTGTTTLTGAVSGAGITSLFASPPAIGGTTASSGAFTTLNASGNVAITGVTNLGGADATGFGNLLVKGLTKGVRVVNSTTGTTIEGVDNTGTGSYQSLSVGGSVLNLTVSGSNVGVVSSTGIAITGVLTVSSTTTLTGAVSGAGITSLFASPPSIGSVTPGTGAFTTFSTTGLIAGGSDITQVGSYHNFSVTQGITGFGFRNNAGTMEFKNSGGSWSAFGTGTGTGTVTSVSVTTANGISGTVATATSTPAITLSLAAITPTTITMSGAMSGGTTADFSTEYRVAGTKVVGARGAAVTTFTPSGVYSSDQGIIASAINGIISRLQTHGLIS